MKNGQFFEITQRFVIENVDYNSKEMIVKDLNTDEQYLMNKNVDINIIGEYKEEKLFKNRRELIKAFEQILPFTANRLLQIEYYKMPNWKELYKSNKTYKSAKEYEKAHRYGEKRIMKGQFVLDGYKFKERDGYLVMADIEDTNIEKPVIIRNLISFVFDNVKYYINE